MKTEGKIQPLGASSAAANRGPQYDVRWNRRVTAGDRRFSARYVAHQFRHWPDDTKLYQNLFADRKGDYWLTEHYIDPTRGQSTKVSKLDGKQAMAWVARTILEDGHFRDQFLAAIDNPEFFFTPARVVRGND